MWSAPTPALREPKQQLHRIFTIEFFSGEGGWFPFEFHPWNPCTLSLALAYLFLPLAVQPRKKAPGLFSPASLSLPPGYSQATQSIHARWGCASSPEIVQETPSDPGAETPPGIWDLGSFRLSFYQRMLVNWIPWEPSPGAMGEG